MSCLLEDASKLNDTSSLAYLSVQHYSLEQATTGMCTASHPFSYLNGKYCCKHGLEKKHGPSGELCDGGAIGFTSLCCKDDAYSGCPDGKICKD